VLVSVHIKDFALVDNITLELSSGLNMITGETGSGKSILIKAISLLLGGRASTDVVRTGSESAVVAAEFQLPKNHPAVVAASELGIDIGNDWDGTLLLRRNVSVKGKSQCFINDVPVSSKSLGVCSMHLLDVFGQHENQKLFDPQSHASYLDLFLKDPSVKERFNEFYGEMRGEMRSLKEFLGQISGKRRDRDYIAFRLDEIDRLDPSEDNFKSLEQDVERADKLGQWLEKLSSARTIIDDGADGSSLSVAVFQAARELDSVAQAHPELSEIATQLKSSAEVLNDVSFSVSKIFENLSESGENAADARDRLNSYYEVMHKLSVRNVDEVLTHRNRFAEDLEALDQTETVIQRKIDRMRELMIGLDREAGALSAQRRKASERLEKEVRAELRDLGMIDAVLTVEFSEMDHAALDESEFLGASIQQTAELTKLYKNFARFSQSGAESVQFLLSANKGEAALPLHRVASGGEASRIMLAIKRVLALDADTCVMVFDEIDTGISGRVADMVGRKLSELGRSFQVICISHLPQVAAYADAHLSVSKVSKGQRTASNIAVVSDRNEIIESLARLMAGDSLSTASKQSAQELLDQADQFKSQKGRSSSKSSDKVLNV